MLVPRLSLTLRALLLVPLFAVGVDVLRATVVCGPQAESCLEAAGRGWLGPAALVLLALYAAALAAGVARLARGGRGTGPAPRSFARLWLVGSAGVGAACGGQALLAQALGAEAALGGGWAAVVPLCLVAGAVIALALRAAPAAAAAALRALRPAAPRLRLVAPLRVAGHAAPAPRALAPLALAAAGRAPPLRG
jgi:hypothetical protein